MTPASKRFSPARLALLAFGAILLGLLINHFRKSEAPPKPAPLTLALREKNTRPPELMPLARMSEPKPAAATNYHFLTNQPMKLVKKVLVQKKWNEGPDAFGLDKPPEGLPGATVGPAAVAYLQGKTYVLDNPNKRILCYDQAGNLLSSVALPNNVATDLSVDSSGSSLILVDHLNDHIYRVDGSELTLLGTVPLREGFPLGTKFLYDSASNTLTPQEVHQDGLADIDGSSLILNLKNGEKVAIGFDRPVACVEEVVPDANGILWVLYTLDGDFQMRRLARVDPTRGVVGLAEIDAWFAFDATRHMTVTENGVVLFAGDHQEGRLVGFDYGGS